MACTKPRTAWKCGLHESGKQKLVFVKPGTGYEVQKIPCGKCISCKLDYSREWATRIVHETKTAQISCFLTLTISPDSMVKKGFTRYEKHLKREVYYPPYSVYKRTVQLFIKRLRKSIAIKHKKKKIYQKIKYFACGEYGDGRRRPHYHIVIMGYDFPDKTFWQYSKSGEMLYRSRQLEKLWQYGYSSIGEVTFNSAAYVARYTLKKTKDKKKYEFVDGYDEETGEIFIHNLNPEFITMSKSIGLKWWQKYYTDTDKDYILVDEKKTKIPRYYDKQREEKDPDSLVKIKQEREKRAKEQQKDDNAKRRMARNIVKLEQNKMLKRGYENEKETIRTI